MSMHPVTVLRQSSLEQFKSSTFVSRRILRVNASCTFGGRPNGFQVKLSTAMMRPPTTCRSSSRAVKPKSVPTSTMVMPISSVPQAHTAFISSSVRPPSASKASLSVS